MKNERTIWIAKYSRPKRRSTHNHKRFHKKKDIKGYVGWSQDSKSLKQIVWGEEYQGEDWVIEQVIRRSESFLTRVLIAIKLKKRKGLSDYTLYIYPRRVQSHEIWMLWEHSKEEES